jgi:hypothetical protein
MIWFQPANSHTGPQLHRCIRGRTDGSIRLRANLLQKPLESGGAFTDEYTRDGASNHDSAFFTLRQHPAMDRVMVAFAVDQKGSADAGYPN